MRLNDIKLHAMNNWLENGRKAPGRYKISSPNGQVSVECVWHGTDCSFYAKSADTNGFSVNEDFVKGFLGCLVGTYHSMI